MGEGNRTITTRTFSVVFCAFCTEWWTVGDNKDSVARDRESCMLLLASASANSVLPVASNPDGRKALGAKKVCGSVGCIDWRIMWLKVRGQIRFDKTRLSLRFGKSRGCLNAPLPLSRPIHHLLIYPSARLTMANVYVRPPCIFHLLSLLLSNFLTRSLISPSTKRRRVESFSSFMMTSSP